MTPAQHEPGPNEPAGADRPPDEMTSPLAEALVLAERAVGLSDPNPRVGCVVVDPAGRTIGRGHTQAAGDAHAEIMALRDAAARGHDVRGATAYVTLEPCSHHGRTPPCADALVRAGVGGVVVALRDPNPQVAGQGLARLAAAGLDVSVLDPADPLAVASRELNIGFLSRMARGRPFVRLKAAISVDGRSALANGRSQWMTGEAARADGHAWRRRASAVLTGVGTVRDDDPRLDVRAVPTARQPICVVVDSRLETPPTARLFAPREPSYAGALRAKPVLVCAAHDDPARRAAIEATGAEVALLPADAAGKVDLAALLAELAARGVNELHVETGEKLAGSFLRAGLVDELLVYLAPMLLGEGRSLAALGPYTSLAEAQRFTLHEVERVDDDLRLRLRPAAPGGLSRAAGA